MKRVCISLGANWSGRDTGRETPDDPPGRPGPAGASLVPPGAPGEPDGWGHRTAPAVADPAAPAADAAQDGGRSGGNSRGAEAVGVEEMKKEMGV